MTKKQILMLLDGKITDDNVCITEGDMCILFDNYADIYDAESNRGEIWLTMQKENKYWWDLRSFFPKKGHRIKGLNAIY